jgi:hypothetical protein
VLSLSAVESTLTFLRQAELGYNVISSSEVSDGCNDNDDNDDSDDLEKKFRKPFSLKLG